MGTTDYRDYFDLGSSPKGGGQLDYSGSIAAGEGTGAPAQETTSAGTFGRSALDMATFGVGDELIAGGKGPGLQLPVLGNITGAMTDQAVQYMDQYGVGGDTIRDMSTEAQTRLSAQRGVETTGKREHPIADIAGSVAGLVGPMVTGYGAIKGAAKGPGLVKKVAELATKNTGTRAVTAGLSGSAQAGIFAANEQQDIAAAMREGGATGVLLQLGLLEPVGALWKMARKSKSPQVVADTHNKLVDMITNQLGVPRDEFPAELLKQRAKALGPNATLADLNEVAADVIFEYVSSPHTTASMGNVKRLMRERADAAPNVFQKDMESLFGTKYVSNAEMLDRGILAREALSPQYDDLFAGSKATAGSQNVYDSLVDTLKGKHRDGILSVEDKDILKFVTERMFNQKGVSAKNGSVPFRALTAENLHSLRVGIDKQMAAMSGAQTSQDALDFAGLAAVRSRIDGIMAEILPEVKKLDALYVPHGAAERAMDVGKNFLTDNMSAPEIASAIGHAKPAEIPLMLTAAKSAFIDKFSKAGGKEAVPNMLSDSLKLQRALAPVIGEKAAKDLALAAEAAVVARNTGILANVASRHGAGAKQAITSGEAAASGAVIGAGASGLLSSSLAAGRTMSLMRSLTGGPTRPTAEVLDTLGGRQGSSLLQVIDDLAKAAAKPAKKPTSRAGTVAGGAEGYMGDRR